MQKFIQTDTEFFINTACGNKWMREWQLKYEQRKILNVQLSPVHNGWFFTIVYEMEV